ncbi:suppressor of cytokine signaling 4 [Gasterosteus aculeatus]|uniref:Suppressor of cytokine signaling 4 n=2 Tax=Gasterosteus aculeatus TaxID=69293 RepID=G3PZ28_GASAC|nr:suppressor of cytokine signaling 4 [Gasterosteus aculeatus]XP_040051157.1 suppressor of cytokine signaling 4 isoform X1 [Gasterosteus aculeatus aculeatus]ABQ28699.1 suppressor of cytokine signaling 4 [Gasterosteus aculeatus]
MSERTPPGSDPPPKSGLRSWSADSYVWRGKKRSRSSRPGSSPGGAAAAADGPEDPAARSTSCPRRRRDRRCSCGALGDTSASGDRDSACRKALSRRSLRQKFQDAVGQCFPLRPHHHHHHQHHVPPGSSRPFSVLFWSKRKVHVSELMQDKCPFSPRSELARCWHLVKSHAAHPGALKDTEAPLGPSASSSSASPQQTPPAWEDICCSPGPRGSSLEDWDPSCPRGGPEGGHTDYILVPDLLQINNSCCYWGVLNRFEAEELLEGKPEGTFLLRDSAQDEFLFSVSFRRYSRSLHARIEQNDQRFSFDVRDPCMYRDASVTGLLRHYSDPATCLFFEPLLSRPLPRSFPFTLQHLCRAVICSRTTYRGVDDLPLPPQLRDYLRQYHVRCDGACAV